VSNASRTNARFRSSAAVTMICLLQGFEQIGAKNNSDDWSRSTYDVRRCAKDQDKALVENP
jgi:hypothetical protein